MTESTALAIVETRETESFWIGSGELAVIAGISERNAKKALAKCHVGDIWRGHQLAVRTVAGIGGNAGKAYQVNVTTLPPELRHAWQKRHPDPLRASATQAATPSLHIPDVADPKMSEHWAEAQWRFELLYPALAHPPRSHARGEEIRAIVERQHQHWNNKMLSVSRRWCEQQIGRFEAAEALEKGSGIYALMRKPRDDKKNQRVLVCLRWQTACPLPEAEKQRIAGELETYINSLWANGAPTWHRVEALASAKLLNLSRAAGWAEATLDTCRIGRHAAERGKKYRLLAIRDQDAKQFHDFYQPRVQRTRDGLLPMDIVVGDVHPIDILVYREDGSQTTVRAIAWLDLATNRIHATLIQLRPREGVKQIHVAQSFIEMVKAWGLPRRLYLDNGSEYSWKEMMDGFRQLAGLAARFQFDFKADLVDHDEVVGELSEEVPEGTYCNSVAPNAVIRAQPYNAQAKPIEGIFGVLETTVFPMIQGYIGGNRMEKKTHNVGKAPKPFAGDLEAFHDALVNAIDFYHRQEQKRDGMSPLQRLEAFTTDGWRAVKVPEPALTFAFSTLEQIQVRNSGITLAFNGCEKTYWHSDMIRLIRSKTAVRHAKHDPSFIFFTNHEGKWVAAAEGPRFQIADTSGAKEKGRRAKLSNAYISELRANVVRLDLVNEMDAFNAMTPNPETQFGAEIALTPEMEELADAKAALGRSPARPALPPGKVYDEVSGKVIDMFPTLPESKAEDDDELPSTEDFWRAAAQRTANGDD